MPNYIQYNPFEAMHNSFGWKFKIEKSVPSDTESIDSNTLKPNAHRIVAYITECDDDIKFIDIADVEPGHMACIQSPYENYVVMVESVSNDRISMTRHSGKQYHLFKGDNYGNVTFSFFVPTNNHINWFLRNLEECLDSPYDVSNISDIIDVIMEKYPEEYKNLTIPKCSMCGGVAIPRITVDGVVLCEDCFERIYANCAHCGKTTKRDSSRRDKNGNYLCEECNKRHWVLPYHSYYPSVEFYGDNKNNSVPFMGFELEVDCGGESNNNVAQLMPLINKEDTGKVFAYCSRDGSLDEGFEIITQPATMQYHLSIRDVYNRATQKLKSMGYASHETTTCGLHVHFNRSFFDVDSEACIRRLLRLTDRFWNELCIFARRPERRMARYAKKMPDDMSISDYVRRANRSREHGYHYYAVNISNSDTIEIRIFRGTLNINTIMATLQLVNNMAVFAKNKTMEQIDSITFDDLLTTSFQRKYWARRSAVLDFEE